MTSILHQQTPSLASLPLSHVDKVVQSVTNATKRLSQISTNTNSSAKKRKAQNKIGPWKLGRTLGRGSTGRVRLAKNVRTGKLAAVKIVPKLNFKKLENPKYKNHDATRLPYGIEREIIIMKLISHPNIMGLYDVWENKNDLYLILEYIEGGELFDYLIKRGRLLEVEAINYFRQIIHGIGYLHQFNICHRDLKPENLLLDFDKKIKIADFGMAALEVDEKLLETSCGSPHYASPEIVAGKNYHGAPSDIWSCGIILFALLTGHLPFDDENIRKLLMKVQNGRFIMPTDLSWEAKDLISKMLQVNPDDRITIEGILRHPLLTKHAGSPDDEARELDLILHSNIKPIQSMDSIDTEIVRNLCILFHNCPEEQVIKCLLSPNKSPEKMFYYLLMKYRNEHSYSSGSYNYADDDTDITPSGSKQTLPRSTSVIKTTTTTQTGEQLVTIEKIPHSASSLSSTSAKKKALSNITNSSFTASSSHKKKTLLKNTVISRKSSTTSLKQTKNRVLLLQANAQNLPLNTQEHKPILKKLTPGLIDFMSNLNPEDDKNSNKAEIGEFKDENKENFPGGVADTTILRFEKVCQDIFGSDVDTKSMYNLSMSLDKRDISTETLNKLKILNSRMSKGSLLLPQPTEKTSNERKLSKVEMIERKLAKEVQQRNNDRERMMKDNDLTAKLKAEEKRQSKILQEKQREALKKINDIHAHRNSSAPIPAHRISSLDPKTTLSPLLRARSMHHQTTTSKTINAKNSVVLQRFGIDMSNFSTSKSLSRSSSLMKTSTSKNLAGILANDMDSQFETEIETSSRKSINRDYDSKRNSSGTLHESLMGSKQSLSSIQASKRENSRSTFGYRSMLDAIDESKGSVKQVSAIMEGDSSISNLSEAKKQNAHSKTDLIPNPRFSRISFNGLLNVDSTTMAVSKDGLSSGTVVKRGTRQLLATKKGNGLISKAPSSEFLGLGIKVSDNIPEREDDSSCYSKNFISIPSVEEHTTTNVSSSLEQNAISINDSDTLSSDTIGEDREISDHLINMNDDYFSRKGITHSSTANLSKMESVNRKGSSSRKTSGKTSNGSRETLVGEESKELISSMYKSYETLYSGNKNAAKSKAVADDQRSTFNADVLNVDILDHSLEENTHISSHSESMLKDLNDEDVNEGEGFLDEASISLEAAENESLSIERNGTVKSSLRRSQASTQIFSTMKMNEKAQKPKEEQKNAPLTATQPTTTPKPLPKNALTPKDSVLRRLSLKPKREAPKAPEVQVWEKEKVKGHNRFSGISVKSNAKQFFSPKMTDTPKVGGWFKRFFQSFTKGREESTNDNERASRRDVYIIDTSISAHDLMRVIRNQMKMKEIEGSVTQVDIDEEFALINGVIPSKFARGRKLHFKIEIIDLVNTSSLHLLKIKGSRTGFKNLVDVVQFVVRQEEEASDVRRKSGYNFSGYRA